jgi:hypothetical protein
MSKRPIRRRPQRRAKASPTPSRSPKTPQPLTPFGRELTTKRRGEISELAFALAAARHGFGIAKPFGDSERYDIILDPSHLPAPPTAPPNPDARPRLVRVQVKSSTQLQNGLYHINAHRRINGRAVPYKLSEIDFIVAYIIPEDSWFILPLAHILGQTSLLFRPKRSPIPSPYNDYRESWHLLHQPDGLTFA